MRGFVCPSVGPSIIVIKFKSGQTRVSAPAHPSATGNSYVSDLVQLLPKFCDQSDQDGKKIHFLAPASIVSQKFWGSKEHEKKS